MASIAGFLRRMQAVFSFRSSESSGDRGERLAADWLRRERGFTVVASNWRSPRDRRDEIDLVCFDKGVIVFVEVKTRAASALVPGYFAVDRRKKRVVKRAAESYLHQLREKPHTFRFDVVEVTLPAASASRAGAAPSSGSQVLHFENVPLFPKHYRP